VNTVIGPATSGTLVLAEAAGGWSATLNGKPLATMAKPVDGWAQGFVLPAGGGHLVISRNGTARDVSLIVEAVAFLVAFALALPGTRASVAAPAVAAASADSARPGHREQASRARAARRRRRPQLALAGIKARGVRPGRRADDQVPEHASPALAESDTPAAAFASAAATPYTSAPDTPYTSAPDTASHVPAAAYVSRAAFAPAPDDPFGSGAPNDPFGSGADVGSLGSGAASEPSLGSGAAPAPVRRGGQHAARHGKPSRRRRGDSS